MVKQCKLTSHGSQNIPYQCFIKKGAFILTLCRPLSHFSRNAKIYDEKDIYSLKFTCKEIFLQHSREIVRNFISFTFSRKNKHLINKLEPWRLNFVFSTFSIRFIVQLENKLLHFMCLYCRALRVVVVVVVVVVCSWISADFRFSCRPSRLSKSFFFLQWINLTYDIIHLDMK